MAEMQEIIMYHLLSASEFLLLISFTLIRYFQWKQFQDIPVTFLTW